MHEQTAETPISLDIDTVWSESLLSAWTSALADLSLFGLQAILLVRIFKNLLRFMEMLIGMIKIMTLNKANALCEYMIICLPISLRNLFFFQKNSFQECDQSTKQFGS